MLSVSSRHGSSFEHFVRTVSPRHWEKVLIAMYTVCFDTGRKKISEGIVAVVGFAAFTKTWQDFEVAWNACLRKYGLTYFHAGELAHFTNQFRHGWREDEGKRRALQADLMDVIWSNELRRFGCCIPLAVHNEIDADIRGRSFDAYVHAALASVDHFNSYARSIRAERVKYVFEKGEREDDLRKRFAQDGYSEPHFTWKRPHRDRKGFLDDGFIGLQAAGWIAYEYWLDVSKTLDFGKPLTEKIESGRWAFQQFEKMLGVVQIAVTPESSQMVMRIRDDTRYLNDLKPKGKAV